MTARTVVITGANRGIGLALTQQLLASGHEVFGVCRSSSESLQSTRARIVEGVDVRDPESLHRLTDALAGRRVDWLVCNAGVLARETLSNLDLESIRRQFDVNALGPLLTVVATRPFFGAGSKIGIVSSRMGSLQDNTSGSAYGYRMSKAAANMVGVNLAHEFSDMGVAVAVLHPGWVKTDMTGGRGLVSPDEAAAGLIARMEELNMSSTGTFWHANGETLPW